MSSLSESAAAARRWYPPHRLARVVRWILLAHAAFTLLTNAYYLRFLEPAISRKWLALIALLLALAEPLASRFGLPFTASAAAADLKRLAWPSLLGLTLVVAFGFRLWGIAGGLPQSYVVDEYDYVHAVLKMIKRGDLNPHWWYHPSLQPYLTLVTYLVVFFLQVPGGRWSSVHQIVEEDMLYWGRFVGVVFGTATVLVTFLLGRRLFGTRVGLMAAALLAVFPGAVEHSQYNKPDPVLAFMTALSVLVTLIYLMKGGRKLALACGLAFGFTVAAKYNGALVFVPFFLAVALRHGRRLLAEPDLYLAAAGSVVAFFAGCPYFLAELPRFLDQVADGLYTYGFAGRPGAEGVDNWYNHAKYTVRYGAGLPAFLAGVTGLGLALYRLDARLAVFLAFPLLYYSYYSSQRILFPGNLIPVYPFLAVLGAYTVNEAAAWLAGWRVATRQRGLEPYAVAALMALLLWFPVGTSIRFNTEATRRDTGSYAREWIDRSFPPGTHFAVERHTPVLDRNRFKVTIESRIINRAVRDYRAEGVQYLIVSSIVYRRFSPEHRQTRQYQKLFEICPLVAEFTPIRGQRPGPTIRILRVPPAGAAEEASDR